MVTGNMHVTMFFCRNYFWNCYYLVVLVLQDSNNNVLILVYDSPRLIWIAASTKFRLLLCLTKIKSYSK